MSIELTVTKRTDPRLLERMAVHYSQPKGFVGRVLSYAVTHDDIYYGHIIAGSAVKHLPGRHDGLGTDGTQLNSIVNNIFFNVSAEARYPMRNFTSRIVRAWRERVRIDWSEKYGDDVLGFETLIELPRTGELYRRDGWEQVGVTKGYTCKRVSGSLEGQVGDYKTSGRDSWSGRRVWDTKNLRPKLVLVRGIL